MNRIRFFLVFILTVSGAASSAGDMPDFKALSAQCIMASRDYRPVKDNFPYKLIHTVEYAGWSGDSEHMELIHPVVMTMTFIGNKKEGAYWLESDPQKKFRITMKSDQAGNCELKEISEHGRMNLVFHGVMKKGVIMGMWEMGNGENTFPFYVKVRK